MLEVMIDVQLQSEEILKGRRGLAEKHGEHSFAGRLHGHLSQACKFLPESPERAEPWIDTIQVEIHALVWGARD